MPRCQKNPRPPDATPGEPGLEPPNEPRQDQDRLEIRPPGRASQIRLQKELFHPVRALVLCSSVGNRWYQKYVVPRFSAPFKIAKRNSTRAPSSPSTGRTNRAPECCRSDSSPQTRLPPGVSRPSATCYATASICAR